jgi:hypothetical protein
MHDACIVRSSIGQEIAPRVNHLSEFLRLPVIPNFDGERTSRLDLWPVMRHEMMGGKQSYSSKLA